jgi:hypothetical protein
VLTRPDYLRAADSLDRLLWRRAGDTDADRERARLTLEQVPVGEGALQIYALDLGRLVPGKRAVIDYMSFGVELCLPPGKP